MSRQESRRIALSAVAATGFSPGKLGKRDPDERNFLITAEVVTGDMNFTLCFSSWPIWPTGRVSQSFCIAQPGRPK